MNCNRCGQLFSSVQSAQAPCSRCGWNEREVGRATFVYRRRSRWERLLERWRRAPSPARPVTAAAAEAPRAPMPPTAPELATPVAASIVSAPEEPARNESPYRASVTTSAALGTPQAPLPADAPALTLDAGNVLDVVGDGAVVSAVVSGAEWETAETPIAAAPGPEAVVPMTSVPPPDAPPAPSPSPAPAESLPAAAQLRVRRRRSPAWSVVDAGSVPSSAIAAPEGAGRARRFLATAGQVVLVLVIVGFFFSGFSAVISGLFPTGESGSGWIRQAALELPGEMGAGFMGRAPVARTLQLWTGDQSSNAEFGQGLPVAATLTFKKNDVRSRRAQEIAWAPAGADMALYDHDAVQTLDRSRAIVTFDPKNFLDLDENAMVIIKRLEDDTLLKDRRAFLVVVEGNLRGRVEASAERNVDLSVATSAGVVRVKAARAHEPRAEFAVKVGPDQSTSLTVYQ